MWGCRRQGRKWGQEMIEEELRFVDDKLFVYTHLPQFGEEIYKVQLVMTKEIFKECYKKWVKPQEAKNTVTHLSMGSPMIEGRKR